MNRMRLRQRLVLIGLGAFALVVGVVLAGSNAILLRSYRNLERQDVVRNLERVRDALSQDVNGATFLTTPSATSD